MYDLRRLRLLLELRRRGTLNAVATAVNCSPSAVSQQLSKLEDEVGTILLEPAGRRVQLTPQADVLCAHAERVFRELESAEVAVAKSLATVTGTVRIAIFQTGLLCIIPPALELFATTYAELRVEVFQAEPEVALPGLLDHQYDLVVALEFPDNPLPWHGGVDYQDLLYDRMRIAVPVGQASVGDIWQLVRNHPWVVESLGATSRVWIEALCRELGFEPDIRFIADDLLVQERLVATGCAVAILPDILGAEERPGIVLADIPHGPYARRILTAARRSTTERPSIVACRDVLMEVCRNRGATRTCQAPSSGPGSH